MAITEVMNLADEIRRRATPDVTLSRFVPRSARVARFRYEYDGESGWMEFTTMDGRQRCCRAVGPLKPVTRRLTHWFKRLIEQLEEAAPPG